MKAISKLTSFILTIVFLVLMFMIYRLNLVPVKYFLPGASILLLFILLLDFKLLRKKTGIFSRIFFNFISIVFILVACYGLTYINATYNFMKNILSTGYEIKNYVVVVNKKSSASELLDLTNSTVGHLKTENNYSKISKKMKKVISFEENEFDEVVSFTNFVINNNDTSIVLEKEYYNLLKEEFEGLNNTKIIKSYKVLVKNNNKKLNKKMEDPFIMYISGIDTYGNISNVSRSDVNIVAVVNPKTEKILLVSIPRDYYVNLHGVNSKDKLTHAGIYGIDMSINTINDLLEIDIDYYLRLNFSTLTKSIDLIGGIDVYSDTEFTPWTNKNITIHEGTNHMDGKTALAFARERHAYLTGDRHRGQNQQAIITAMIEKLADVKNITKYKSILSSLDGTFETSMNYEELTDLFKIQINNKIHWNVESISLDGTGNMKPTYSMGSRNLYVMIPDETSISTAKYKIEEYIK